MAIELPLLVTATRLTVYVIWWVVLAVAVFIIVPVVVSLLHRGLRAARAIEHYSARTLTAGAGIANNTAAVVALQDTITVATDILGAAGQIEQHTRAMKETLAGRMKDEG